MARLKGGYFGTRGPEMFSPYFLEQIAGTRFIDITGGTGQFPYYLATEKDTPVGLMERCPYVGYLLRSIFGGIELPRVVWGPGDAAREKDFARTGYLHRLCSEDDKVGGAINGWVASSVDGFMIANKDNPLALHCMARAINRAFLYRGVNISRTTTDGRKTKNIEYLEVRNIAKRTYDRMLALRLGNRVRHWVRVGDSTEEIGRVPRSVIDGSVVYADPAWPYAKQFGSQNPYKLAYEFLSSIMLQEQLTLDKVWEVTKRKQIYSDVATWINTSFERGARMFILCSQDTNFPDEGEVKEWVRANWCMQKHERSDDFSSFANRKYITYWFYLTPE